MQIFTRYSFSPPTWKLSTASRIATERRAMRGNKEIGEVGKLHNGGRRWHRRPQRNGQSTRASGTLPPGALNGLRLELRAIVCGCVEFVVLVIDKEVPRIRAEGIIAVYDLAGGACTEAQERPNWRGLSSQSRMNMPYHGTCYGTPYEFPAW